MIRSSYSIGLFVHYAKRPDKPPTRREREIAHMVHDGMRNKQIARQLGITEGTVKIHLYNIYRKCGLCSRTRVILAVERGEL